MSHPVESVYSALTSILIPYMGEPVPVQRNCSCCGRPPSAFDGVGFEMVNAYRERVVHCRPCQTFFISAPQLMGVENPKKPTTGQKFGMWSGVGTVINVADNTSVLLAPQGVVNKLPGHFFDLVEVVTATSGQHLEYLFNASLQFPLIYIQNFGVKTYELVRSLRVSLSADAIFTCADQLLTRQNEVLYRLDLKKAKALHQAIKNYSRKEIDLFIRTVTQLAYSRITPAAASNEFRKNGFLPLLQLLPTDPHQRLSILHLLKKV
ncbi:hypothetical protein [Klebsiella quasipneumoniae]|uniref:hypothetical protein n=1 Tax=Klebsiella quasipneumoniae TaxID=1463165 RepID=UPI002ABB3061|nr:hypothetical protein [Klebsiella quasipneumoniae]MDZ0180509.1 hypothetical protein [Klebsiella quasipneumoniae]